MVDIRDLLRNQEAKLRQQRTQFWRDALAKQDQEFIDRVVKTNKELIREHVALQREIRREIAAQLGEDQAKEMAPEDGAAGIAEKLLDACVEFVVSPYMDGKMDEEDEKEEASPVEMDVDESEAGSASGSGFLDSEAGPSKVESLYEEHTSGMSSPSPWAREPSSDDDVQIIDAEDVPAHIRVKGEPEDTAKLSEIREVSRSSRSSFSPEFRTKAGTKSKLYRSTSSMAGGIGASRPVGFDRLWKEGEVLPWAEVENRDYIRCTYHGIAHENRKRSYYIVRCRNDVNDTVVPASGTKPIMTIVQPLLTSPLHHFKVSPFKSNNRSSKNDGTGLHTLMAHLGRPSPYDPPCHDVDDMSLPLDWKSACQKYGIEVTMPNPPDTPKGIALNEYILTKSNRKNMYDFDRREKERRKREEREGK